MSFAALCGSFRMPGWSVMARWVEATGSVIHTLNFWCSAWNSHEFSWRRRFVPNYDNAQSNNQNTYDYAVIRVVPRVEREEFINVGVIVSCPAKKFLEARIEVDEQRLRAL